ncbi:MAG: response regulator transcription factor [Bacteroidota bacterium]
MIKLVLRFGLLSILIFVLLELGQYSLRSSAWFSEMVLVICAVALVIFGIILRNFITTRKDLLEGNSISNLKKLDFLKISPREHEVLIKIAEGYSNNEIAEKLFVSENTIKTHVSNLYIKLNVKRRTEAIRQAKAYGIL